MQEKDFQECPEEFICPISQMPMQDPVMTEDGHSFDRESIEHWFDLGKSTNPLTNLKLVSKKLIPNIALKNALESHLQKTRNKQTTEKTKKRHLFYRSLLSQRNIIQDPRILEFQEKMKSNFKAYQKWRDFSLQEKNIEAFNSLKIDSSSYKGIKAIYSLKGGSMQGINPQEKGIIYYEEGNIFYGLISFNLPLQGLMIEKNGTKKEGQFHNNSITFGLITFNNEDFFFGEFSNDSPVFGIKQTREKKFIGKFSEQAQLVKGVVLYKSGEKFEGRLCHEKQMSGKFNFKNGNIFQGEFYDGAINKGILYYTNGDKFQGKFQFGEILQGKFTSKAGKVFKGSFINGVPSLGRYFDQQGSQIIEIFQNGKPVQKKIEMREEDLTLSYNISYLKRCFKGNGIVEGLFQDNILKEGTQKYLNGQIFEGNFENELPSNGKFLYKNGITFHGVFKNGNPFKGVLTFPDDRAFQGEFDSSNELCPLYGRLVYPSGQEIKGYVNSVIRKGLQIKLQFSDSSEKIFLNGDKFQGKFIQQSPESGKIFYHNGCFFEGILQDGRKPLKGKIRFKDNSIFKGKFFNGKPFQGMKHLLCGNYFEGIFNQTTDEGKVSGVNIKKYYQNGDCIIANFIQETLIPGEYVKEYANGSEVKGYFKKEHNIRKGQKIFLGHKKFVGLFKCENIRKGVMQFSDHSTFEGSFWSERPSSGKLSLVKGDQYAGRFNQNLQLIGKGKIIFSNEDEYFGYLQNNLPEGRGIYTYKRGDRIECEWKEGKKHGTGIITYHNNKKMRATWFEDKVQETFEVQSENQQTLNWQLYKWLTSF